MAVVLRELGHNGAHPKHRRSLGKLNIRQRYTMDRTTWCAVEAGDTVAEGVTRDCASRRACVVSYM